MKTHTFNFNELPQEIILNGNFDSSCKLEISQQSLNSIKLGRLKVRINVQGGKSTIHMLNLLIKSDSGNINIFISSNNAEVAFEKGTRGAYNLRLWNKSKVYIGNNTTSNGVRIICDNSEFICGKDCMFSDEILIQTADQHGIVDLKKGKIINQDYRSVTLGDHVWLGRKCTLTGNSKVGTGSIIGTGAIVTNSIPQNTIAVGVPAKVIKENHTWSRSVNNLDLFSKESIEEYKD